MHTIAVIIVFAFNAEAYGLAANYAGGAQDSMDKLVDNSVNHLVDNLLHRGLKAWTFQHVTLENATLGKAGNLAISSQFKPTPLLPNAAHQVPWAGYQQQLQRHVFVPRDTLCCSVMGNTPYAIAIGAAHRIRGLRLGMAPQSDVVKCQSKIAAPPTQASRSDQSVVEEEKKEWYEVRDVSPPAKDLGMYPLPRNTQCGEVIAVEPKDLAPPDAAKFFKAAAGKNLPDVAPADVAKFFKAAPSTNTEAVMDDKAPEKEENQYMVQSVTSRYRLRHRKYVLLWKRLDVKPLGRYFAERRLNSLLKKSGRRGDEDQRQRGSK